MHYIIGTGQLRSATRYYLKLAENGHVVSVKRRGVIVASIYLPEQSVTSQRVHPTSSRAGSALRVDLPAFRTSAGRYLDIVADGATVEICDRGRPTVRISSAAALTQHHHDQR